MEKILVSACLAGEKVRYDGKIVPMAGGLLEKWFKQGRLISVCPEVCGGLSIPRAAAQIVNGSGHDVLHGKAKVISVDGKDVTGAFIRGAEYALFVAKKYDIRLAIFKEKSPSCGVHQIYDGSFSSCLVPGEGASVALLKENQIKVFSENDLEQVESFLSVARPFKI